MNVLVCAVFEVNNPTMLFPEKSGNYVVEHLVRVFYAHKFVDVNE